MGLFAEANVTFLQIELPWAQLGLISEEVAADTAVKAPPPRPHAARGGLAAYPQHWRCVWTGTFSWVLICDGSLYPCPLVSVCVPPNLYHFQA